METCQAIPSILFCFWPAHHPKDTTKVNVLRLSCPPPNFRIFLIPTLLSLSYADLKLDQKPQKYNFSFTKLFDKVCAQR